MILRQKQLNAMRRLKKCPMILGVNLNATKQQQQSVLHAKKNVANILRAI